MIDKLIVKSFKSLRSINLTPQNVNLVIGANGTGKSNFADVFEFVSYCLRYGLKEAVDKFNGLDEIRAKKTGSGRPYTFHIEVHLGQDTWRGIKSAVYSFSLAQTKGLAIESEHLEASVYPRSSGHPTREGGPNYDFENPVQIQFARKGDKLTTHTKDIPFIFPEQLDDSQTLFLSSYGKFGPLRTIADYLASFRVYNIDAVLGKRATNGGDQELSRYGENLVMFLRRVLSIPSTNNQLLSDLREAVPYIKSIVPDKIFTMPTLKFLEADSNLELFAPQMSDGTVRLLGLLAVLHQKVPPAVIAVEEPENALHAYAVDVFLRIAAKASIRDRFPIQVFLTSHSPWLVDGVLGLDFPAHNKTKGFVSKRVKAASTIEQAPVEVIKGISKNLGRPSDYLREGSFGDRPGQLALDIKREGQQ